MLYEDLLLHELIKIDDLAPLQGTGKCGPDHLCSQWAKFCLQSKHGGDPGDPRIFGVNFFTQNVR
jgi:hypothetical protein